MEFQQKQALLQTLLRRQKLPMHMQSEASECALACLAMVAEFYGAKVDLITLRRHFSVSLRGARLSALLQTADRIGLASRAVKVPLESLNQLQTPAILHWDFNHFVVLKQCGSRSVTIHDPATGVRKCSIEELSDSFTGVGIELTPTALLRDFKVDRRLSFASIWQRTTGLTRTLAQVVLLSLLLQSFLVFSPLYMQIVIDEVLPNFNRDLLVTLALGFALFTLINGLTEALRSYVLIHSGAVLSFQFAADLFSHLTRLPLDYFEKRHVGDLLTRFGSLEPIKEALIQGVASVFIDGLMLLVTLVLMLLYSPKITLAVILALALYSTLRLLMYRRLRSLSEQAIVAKSKEDSLTIETLRAMLPLKVFCREAERRQRWQNLLAKSVSADTELAVTQMWFALASSLIFGMENVFVIYIGATEVLKSVMTIGMLFAFFTYKRQFVDTALKVLEVCMEFKMLNLHFERLADITSSSIENAEPEAAKGHDAITSITLRGVCYAYASDQGETIKNLNLDIPGGQRLALTGPSGCGKTTLVKILLGLLQPQKGAVLPNGVSIKHLGLGNYRKSVAAVMQDDQLLAGTIAENISFFANPVDLDFVFLCAQHAAIYNEVMAMPMSFETLIGDMGSALSGGQKQRILLARALYARPELLVLDEGTAHLDAATETAVNDNLRKLDITIISVAHREAALRWADRVITMNDGRVQHDRLQHPD